MYTLRKGPLLGISMKPFSSRSIPPPTTTSRAPCVPLTLQAPVGNGGRAGGRPGLDRSDFIKT